MANPLLKNLLKGGGSVAAAEYGAKIAGLLLLPLFTYYLTAQEFGLLSMFNFVSSMALIFFNPGLISAYIRLYYTETSEDGRNVFNWNAYLLFLGWPLLIVFCLAPFITIFGKSIFREFTIWPYGVLAILTAYLMNTNRFWSKILIISKDFKRLAIFNLGALFLGLAVSVFLIAVVNMGVNGRIIGIFVSVSVLTISANAYFLKRFRSSDICWVMQKKLLSNGMKISMATWSLFILNLADRYMIELYMGLEPLGYYQVYYTIALIPVFLTSGLISVWNPMFLEKATQGLKKDTSYLVRFFLSITVPALIISIIFQYEIISIMVNEKFYTYRDISYILTAGAIFLVLLDLPVALLGKEMRFGCTSRAAATAALSNIALNLWLIPNMGIYGAALATFASYLIYYVILIFMIHKTLVSFIPLRYIFIGLFFPLFCLTLVLFFDGQISHIGLRIMIKFILGIILISCFLLILGFRLPKKSIMN